MNIIETAWNWTSGLSKRKSTNLIVLHHAAAVTCTAAQIDSWHKRNSWSGIGYHFFIRKDGTIYRGRPEWAVGAHAQGTNLNSVGVCVEGDYSKERAMPEAQKNAVKEVLKHLKATYPKAVIKGHKEVGATGCPGDYYPLNEMKRYFNNTESEELTMSQYEELKAELKKKDDIINLMGKEIQELKDKTKYHNKLADVPEWYRPAIKQLIESGGIEGDDNGNLLLTPDLMRMLTILKKVGVI